MSTTLILCIALLCVLAWFVQRPRRSIAERGAERRAKFKPKYKTSKSPRTNTTTVLAVSAKTQNHLYRLVGGDRATVERLINYTKEIYPGEPEQWIWEKAITDLERDRGVR